MASMRELVVSAFLDTYTFAVLSGRYDLAVDALRVCAILHNCETTPRPWFRTIKQYSHIKPLRDWCETNEVKVMESINTYMEKIGDAKVPFKVSRMTETEDGGGSPSDIFGNEEISI